MPQLVRRRESPNTHMLDPGLHEEEVFDVGLSSFRLFDREDVKVGSGKRRLVGWGCRGCGGCRGCWGCRGCRGCGGCRGCRVAAADREPAVSQTDASNSVGASYVGMTGVRLASKNIRKAPGASPCRRRVVGDISRRDR